MLFRIKLYEHIKKRPTTLKKISQETGISYTTLSKWLEHSIRRVDTGKVEKLCEFFNCELEDMLEVVEEEKTS